jgi:hypothetical protein
MKMECDVTRDLMPLHIEGLANEGSSQYLLQHIEHCSECREIFEELQKEPVASKENEMLNIKDTPPYELVRRIRSRITGLLVLVFVITIITFGFTSKLMQNRYYPEMTYSMLTYEEAPEFIKSQIREMKLENSTIHVNGGGSGENYVVIIPAVNQSVEVLSVEKDVNAFNGIMYKYRYVDTANTDIIENIRIIKINNFGGRISGVLAN